MITISNPSYLLLVSRSSQDSYDGLLNTVASKIGDTIGNGIKHNKNAMLPFNANSDIEGDVIGLAKEYMANHIKDVLKKSPDKAYTVQKTTEALKKDIRKRIENHLKHHHYDKNKGLDLYDNYMEHKGGSEDLKDVVGKAYDQSNFFFQNGGPS